MPDPRDFLPQPPWEGPPIPEGFVKAFRPTPEQVELIQQVNDAIRKRTTYGVRIEVVKSIPVHELQWSNAGADWGRIRAWPVTPIDPRHIKGEWGLYKRLERRARPGDEVELDANMILAYGRARDIDATLSYLEPLPLYKHSFEAKQRGFGTSPPPWTKHWTWPKLPTMPVVEEKLPPALHKRVELICSVCEKRFEEYRSAEEKLLDTIFGETYCPEHRR